MSWGEMGAGILSEDHDDDDDDVRIFDGTDCGHNLHSNQADEGIMKYFELLR